MKIFFLAPIILTPETLVFSFVRLSVKMLTRCPLTCPQMSSQAFCILNSLGKSHLFPGEPYFFEGLTRKKPQTNKPKNPPYPYNIQMA